MTDEPSLSVSEDDEEEVLRPVEPLEILVENTAAGTRLDVFIKSHVPDRSRALLQKHIERGAVTLNGAPPKRGAKTLVRAGDAIRYTAPPPEEIDLVPEAIPLSILYEDDHVLVIDKPRGLVVHPAAGHPTGTLANAVLHHLKKGPEDARSVRPGIVHRLDRDTTGVIIVAKDDESQEALLRTFRERRVEKHYVAVTVGVPKLKQATIQTLYGRHPRDRKRFTSRVREGKKAITRYRVREVYPGAALLDVDIETGRTHQIRVHLAESGHPLVGDKTYGARRQKPPDPRLREIFAGIDRPALHALRISLDHPATGKRLEVEAPIPEDLTRLVEALRRLRTAKEGGA